MLVVSREQSSKGGLWGSIGARLGPTCRVWGSGFKVANGKQMEDETRIGGRERERERERDVCVCVYIYICIYPHMWDLGLTC